MMEVHLRADTLNPEHLQFTVFINGKNTGRLTMSPNEAQVFANLVSWGCAETDHPYEETGQWEQRRSQWNRK